MVTWEQQPATLFRARDSILRRALSFPVALAAVLAATVFAIARRGLADPDIWWHLRNAQYMFASHAWPRADMYSYTVYGNSWIDHEWLAEIPYYLAWRGLGVVGVKLLSLLLLELTFAGLLYLCWRRSANIKASAAACYFAILVGSVSFGPRTILFGYAYLLVLLFILENFRAHGKASLWLLPVLFCIWINTHGSWSLGLIVFAIFIAGGLFNGRWGSVEAARWTAPQLRRLGAAMAASIVAVFVNPHGYRLVLYPLDMAFRQKLNIAHVAEWSSVDFHDLRGKFALLLVITLLVGSLLGRHRLQMYELGFVLFGIYAAFTYVRFLFLAGILAAPLIAAMLNFIPQYRPEVDRPVLNAAIIAGALAFVVWGFPTSRELSQSIDREYPAEALPQLVALPPSDHVLNYYLWGGYLGWSDPTFRDFIDSRVDVFEYAGVLKDYLDLLELKNPSAILDKYQIRCVLFPPDEPLSYALAHDPQWKTVFRGNVSVLFQRVDKAETSATKIAESGVRP